MVIQAVLRFPPYSELASGQSTSARTAAQALYAGQGADFEAKMKVCWSKRLTATPASTRMICNEHVSHLILHLRCQNSTNLPEPVTSRRIRLLSVAAVSILVAAYS